MNEQKKFSPNLKRSILYISILLLCIIVIFVVLGNKNEDKKITYTEFQQKVEANQVTDIDVVGNVVRVRETGSTIDKESFPKYYDYYFTYISTQELVGFVENHNKPLREDADLENDIYIISANYDFEQESIFASIMPYLSFAVIIIISIFMFRSFSGGTKGAFNYGKSKARMVVSSKVKFSDVAGADEEKAELQEIVEFLRRPQKFTELGARIPKGILLVGNPGTGKTLLAKAVAGESNVPFFSITGSDFVEMFVGVGASRVRDLFDQAKKHSPCIIFIDEIDAVGRQRGAGLGGGNDEREQTLNQLLVELDGFENNEGIIVLAATNRADVLDPALLRPGRFDRQIYVHMPDVKGREAILKIHARNKPLDKSVDLQRVARLIAGFSGADIENLLNEAAILAARDSRSAITMEDVTEGINKVLLGPQKKSRLIKDEDKRITAVHESGHAIVAHLSNKCDKVQEISIVPRGMAGGYTLTLDEKDESHLSREKLLQTLSMMLGGRAAEELILDDITTGASNDMQRVTEIARKMVTEWGMSAKLGLMSLSTANEIFVGRDYQKHVNYSERIAADIDAEIKEIIDTAYNRAKKLIGENKKILNDLVQLLLKKQTIYHEEFELLFKGKSVAEIVKEIDKKEKNMQKRQAKRRVLAENEKKKKEIDVKLKTALALFKAGMITEEDFAKVEIECKEAYEKMGIKEIAADSKTKSEKAGKPVNKEKKSDGDGK